MLFDSVRYGVDIGFQRYEFPGCFVGTMAREINRRRPMPPALEGFDTSLPTPGSVRASVNQQKMLRRVYSPLRF